MKAKKNNILICILIFALTIGQDGKLISATICSDTGEPCAVSYGGKTVDFKIKKGEFITLNENMNLN
jgi:hypothetical protein